MTDQNQKAQPIAIVGIGCMFPGAPDLEAYWSNILAARDNITEVPEDTHWSPEDYFDDDQKATDMTYGRRGGFLDKVDFNPLEFGIPPANLEATDTTQLLGMMVAKQALADAGYGADGKPIPGSRTSVILGVTGTLELVIPLGARLGHPIWRRALAAAGVDAETAEDVVERIRDGYVDWQENSFPGLLGNVVAGRIANSLDLHGTNCVVDAACASSLSAVHSAVMELETGRADMVVTGGMDTFNDIFMYMCFSKTPALSASGNARPFDTDGDGTILGEGLGVVVLKRLADAERDGDQVYAVIRGMGSSSDGKGNAIYAPSSDGQRRALENAYKNADVTPDTIELIEAHGTGTRVGDATEAQGLTSVFGEAEQGAWCALGSVKSMIGHTKAAAGAAGLIKAALAVQRGVLPPTIKVDKPNDAVAPGTTPFYVNTHARPWIPRGEHTRRAGVSAFGFGGSNFHAVVEAYDGPARRHARWDGAVQLVAIAGGSADVIAASLERLGRIDDWLAFRGACADLRTEFDRTQPHRFATIITSDDDRAQRLGKLAQRVRSSSDWTTPDGASYRTGAPRDNVAAMFVGQGAQQTGMLGDLGCRFASFRDAVAEADLVFRDEDEQGRRLVDLIWPHPAFDDETARAQQAALTATNVAQPALGAVSLGALAVLREFGFAPGATAGHSYGELTALCAAGRLNSADLHRLSNLRGRLMAEGSGDRGSMLALKADRDEAESFIKDHELDLVVANHNSPQQVVISGATAEIRRAAELCGAAGLRGVQLDVAAAFHSAFVEASARPFSEALGDVAMTATDTVVYANTTGQRYPADDAEARRLLGDQLARPVDFVGQVRQMVADGYDVFVEIGPGRRLSRMIDAIDASVITTCIDASSGARNGLEDLGRCLADLATAGIDLELTAWDPDAKPLFEAAEAKPKPRMTVPLSGANARPSKPERPRRQPVEPAASPSVATTPNSPAPQPPQPHRPSPAAMAAQPAPAVAQRVQPPPVAPAMIGSPTSDALSALMRMNEQTANLHRQFLENQAAATATLRAMVEGAPVGVPANPAYTNGTTQTWSTPAPANGVNGVQSWAEPKPAQTMQQPTRPAAPDRPDVTPAPAVVPEPAATPAADAAAVLLSIVAEKTGYPTDMLDLSMGLDADLGIDSIKRVEILSELQEQLPQAPAIGPEHLGELQTLGDIAGFLQAGLGTPAALPASAGPAIDVAAVLLGIVADKTGYPADMLDLSMGLDADLGIDSIKRVEILSDLQERLPEAPAIGPEHLGELTTLGHIVDFLTANMSGAPATEPASPPAATVEEIPAAPPTRFTLDVRPVEHTSARISLSGTVVVFGAGPLAESLATELSAAGLDVESKALNEELEQVPDALVGAVFAPDTVDDAQLCQALCRAAQLARWLPTKKQGLFATVARLDGAFGFETGPDERATAGGLGGLAKSAHHEWPAVRCHAFDVAPVCDVDVAARRLVDALLSADSLPVEIGISVSGDLRTLRLVKTPLAEETVGFDRDDVAVVSGGGRGVTADVAFALAEAGVGTLVLLGRSPLPEPEPTWLEGVEGEGAIQKALIAHDRSRSPKEIASDVRRILAARELAANLTRLEAAGATVYYRSVDVRDAEAVSATLAEVRDKTGGITLLAHGAGVLADCLIGDKTPEHFDRVYGTKIDGLRSLLAATEQDSLKAISLFSSSTGRFGRRGQADYAIANEVLDKTAQRLARQGRAGRVVATCWGPWDGGMVTPALKQIFHDEGILCIDRPAGASFLVRELAQPGPAEVVAIAPLGDGASLSAGIAASAQLAPTPQVKAASMPGAPELPVVLSRRVDLESHPFLESHVIGGHAVLPLAVTMEWLAHGALHNHPGLRFAGFDDVRVLKGVILDKDHIDIRVGAGDAVQAGGLYRVPVDMVSGGNNGHRVHHARGEVLLVAGSALTAPEPLPRPDVTAFSRPQTSIYDGCLFHGPHFWGIDAIEGAGSRGIIARATAAPRPGEWYTDPVRNRWITDPLAIDVGFQLAVLWGLEQGRSASLPTFVGNYRQFVRAMPRGGTTVVVTVREQTAHRASCDIDWVSEGGAVVARMTGYECVIDPSLDAAYKDNRLATARP